MKAAVYDRYGPPEVIELRDVEPPRPARGEVLVQVVAAALNPKDALVRGGKFARMTGPDFPKRMGYDFAGRIAALGEGVAGWREGDEVFGMLNGWPGGACAEQLVAPVGEIARKPPRLSMAEAAAIPLAALTALQALRDLGRVQDGQRVCIHGASGGVGTFAVQIAKILGAEVTALCGEASAVMVRGLGADRVFDYRLSPPADLVERFDVMFDVFGNQHFAAMVPRLRQRGLYVTTVPSTRNLRDHALTLLWPGRRARMVVVRSNRPDLEQLAAWAQDGQLKPVLAHTLPLTEARQAHELIQLKRTHGKIVLLTGDGT
ncbi:MAG TPA: NAD(P)-dependent alcohol dehydrogenase [Solimonas sp.]|nr:NAD(P)-dependent alcohol dehydrogenase [Solimonas sp.]